LLFLLFFFTHEKQYKYARHVLSFKRLASQESMDIFCVVETEERTREHIRRTPIRHLHPSDSEKHHLSFGNMIPLLLKIMDCDNAVAFAHVLKRFGMSVRKNKCEGLLRKLVCADSIRIMNLLIDMGVDITQGDHLAVRCARREGTVEMQTFLRDSGGEVGLEWSVQKFARSAAARSATRHGDK